MKVKTKTGVFLLGLCVVSAVATYDSFSAASVILYQNPYVIPAASTVVVMAFAGGLLYMYSTIEHIANCVIGAIEKDLSKKEDEKE